jgi:hypothetical protein
MCRFECTLFDVRCTIRNVRCLMYDVRKYRSFSKIFSQNTEGPLSYIVHQTAYIQIRTLSNFLAQNTEEPLSYIVHQTAYIFLIRFISPIFIRSFIHNFFSDKRILTEQRHFIAHDSNLACLKLLQTKFTQPRIVNAQI